MIFISILIFIVAMALPSINKHISPILLTGISSIVFIYAGALIFNALYIQSIGSGIGIYSGLFQITTLSNLLDSFKSMITSSNISFNLLFKLIFLLIFIILTIYLIDQENIHKTLKNQKFIESSNFNQKLKQIFLQYIPAAIAYDQFLSTKQKGKSEIATMKQEYTKDLNKYKKDIVDLENKVSENNTKLTSIHLDLKNRLSELHSNIVKKDKKIIELDSIREIKDKQISGSILDQIEQNKLKNEISIKQDLTYLESENKRISIDIEQFINEYPEEIAKNSLFNFDFNFNIFDFIKGLDNDELLALGGLLLGQVIFSNTISIILILYGDYLINRFDLENKYPKIAKFIQLRRKYQQYYLKVCFISIFMALLPQFYVYITILLPKFMEIFS